MINDNEIEKWREKGYVILKNVINKQDLINSSNYIQNLYNNNSLSVKDFGSQGKLEFPSETIIDNITLNKNLITIVQKLLNCKEILLIQSDAWGKKGSDNYETSSNNDKECIWITEIIHFYIQINGKIQKQ